jgi:hypothetical protein
MLLPSLDADHAGCRMTRRSHTGILIYAQSSPIIWYSKRQNTVESSTFGSKFIAMKTAVDQIEALRYKLHMMGFQYRDPQAYNATTNLSSRTACSRNRQSRKSTTQSLITGRVKHKHLRWCGLHERAGTQIVPIY